MSQLLIALFIAFEFGCYVGIRQVVNAKEWLSACQSSEIWMIFCVLIEDICSQGVAVRVYLGSDYELPGHMM